jgi:hypothetical protein
MNDGDPDDGNTVRGDRHVPTTSNSDRKRVYWHRELPPFDAEMIGEHVLEATSSRVQGSLAHRDELWDRAYRELMENTEVRMNQEIGRLGGCYAHVLDESIDSRRDDATGDAWLHGLFTYALYGRPFTQNTGH